MANALDGISCSRTRRLLFIFDQQKSFESQAYQQFGAAIRIGRPALKKKYHGILFESRVEVPGLQAADLYAHCWHRYATDENNVGEKRLDALDVLTRKREGMGIFNAEFMEKMLGILPPDVRQAIRATTDPNCP